MLLHKALSLAFATCVFAASMPAQEAARTALRGIEKKDIRRGARVVVVYDEARVKPADAQRFGDALLESPSELEKFTKADAARGIGVVVARESGGDCPPPNCGCDKSFMECTCRKYKETCICAYCLLNYDKVVLDTLGSGRQMGPNEQAWIVLYEIDPAGLKTVLQENSEAIRQALNLPPTATALTIKTKSPRY